MSRTAIVTGIRGQDGSYLAELLLGKGYKVYGLARRSSSNNLGCSSHLVKDIEVFEGDLLDLPSLNKLCKLAKADEFYNMAAQSHVGSSFTQPVYTMQVNSIGVLNCLEAIRESGIHTRFLQASTSEMFGGQNGFEKANEHTPFNPRSPYGVSKVSAHYIVKNYRESYKMFACSSISFNHEGPRRHPTFVTRKISKAVAAIKAGKQDKLFLGNLNASRDWGHAEDFVRGFYTALNFNQPIDFVFSTGKTHTVKEFCQKAFEAGGLGDYQKYVEIDPAFYRPCEVDVLIGDSSLAYNLLNWKPVIDFDYLVREMVNYDCSLLETNAGLK